MRPKSKLLILAAFLVCGRWASAQSVNDENPGSLYPTTAYRNPLADRSARRVGDVVTILIQESSTASFNASTTTSRKDTNDASLTKIPLLTSLLNGLGTTSNSATAGTGATTQVGNFTAKITCLVKKVLPNGNMIIEGQRWIKVNKNYQSFKISGVIRPDDVRVDNTVLSENVAEAEITADGKGQISDRQRRGFLTRILEWLF